MSHPTRGAWIEMSMTATLYRASSPSHPTRGAWIEIGRVGIATMIAGSRTPPGVRGLKSHISLHRYIEWKSHPTRGAWIEIPSLASAATHIISSHPTRGAWIEISWERRMLNYISCRTPPGVRGLKCTSNYIISILDEVAPHPGCVD